MIGAALRSVLEANSDLTALVGSKVYPLIVPQGRPYPAVVYQLVSDTPVYCKVPGGASADEYRVQISVFAAGYLQMEGIAKAIRTVLDNYSGTSETEQIIKITLDNQREVYEEDSKLFHRAMDYLVFVHNH